MACSNLYYCLTACVSCSGPISRELALFKEIYFGEYNAITTDKTIITWVMDQYIKAKQESACVSKMTIVIFITFLSYLVYFNLLIFILTI